MQKIFDFCVAVIIGFLQVSTVATLLGPFISWASNALTPIVFGAFIAPQVEWWEGICFVFLLGSLRLVWHGPYKAE